MLKKIVRIGVLSLLVVALAAFALAITGTIPRANPPYEGVSVLGTDDGEVYTFRAYGAQAQNALDEVARRVQEIKRHTLQGGLNADVERINANPDTLVEVGETTLYLLYAASEYNQSAMGRYSVADYNARAAYGLEPGSVYNKGAIEALAQDAGMEALNIRFGENKAGLQEGTQLTLQGALGGYIADQAAAIARDSGVEHGLMLLKNEAVAIGSRPDGGWWTYRVPHPVLADEVLGVLLIKDQAVASFGTYCGQVQIDGQYYPALIDPLTQAPVDGEVQSVTVVAPSAAQAAAFARALMCMDAAVGEAVVRSSEGMYAIVVTKDAQIHISPALERLFTLRNEGYAIAQ